MIKGCKDCDFFGGKTTLSGKNSIDMKALMGLGGFSLNKAGWKPRFY
jgi:hypothetical protein